MAGRGSGSLAARSVQSCCVILPARHISSSYVACVRLSSSVSSASSVVAPVRLFLAARQSLAALAVQRLRRAASNASHKRNTTGNAPINPITPITPITPINTQLQSGEVAYEGPLTTSTVSQSPLLPHLLWRRGQGKGGRQKSLAKM